MSLYDNYVVYDDPAEGDAYFYIYEDDWNGRPIYVLVLRYGTPATMAVFPHYDDAGYYDDTLVAAAYVPWDWNIQWILAHLGPDTPWIESPGVEWLSYDNVFSPPSMRATGASNPIDSTYVVIPTGQDSDNSGSQFVATRDAYSTNDGYEGSIGVDVSSDGVQNVWWANGYLAFITDGDTVGVYDPGTDSIIAQRDISPTGEPIIQYWQGAFQVLDDTVYIAAVDNSREGLYVKKVTVDSTGSISISPPRGWSDPMMRGALQSVPLWVRGDESVMLAAVMVDMYGPYGLHILRSTDGGNSWSEVAFVSRDALGVTSARPLGISPWDGITGDGPWLVVLDDMQENQRTRVISVNADGTFEVIREAPVSRWDWDGGYWYADPGNTRGSSGLSFEGGDLIAREASVVSVLVPPSGDVGPPPPDDSCPVRVQLDADTGGPFVEPRTSVTYLPHLAVDVGGEYTVRHELSGLVFWPWHPARITTGPSGLTDVSGETIIGRLEHIEFRDPLLVRGPFSASGALNKVLETIRDRYLPELDWEPIPPLFVKGERGWMEPAIDAISIIPEEGQVPTAREVLRQFLEPFLGYFLMPTADGKLRVYSEGDIPKSGKYLTALSPTFTGAYPTPIRLEVSCYIPSALPGVPPTPCGFEVADLDKGETHDFPISGVHAEVDADGNLTVQRGPDYDAKVVVYTAPAFARITEHLEEAEVDIQDTARVINHAIVRNEGFYDYVADQAVIQQSWFRAWGYGYWCNWPQEFPHPTESEIGPPSGHNLGLIRLKDVPHDGCGGTTGWVYVGRAPAVANTLLGGDSISVSVDVSWWGDQCGDFPGPGHLGDSHRDVSVPVGGSAEVWIPSPVPGPPWPPCTNSYIKLRFSPAVNPDGTLAGLDIHMMALLADMRIGLPPPGGDGKWGVGCGVIVNATGERWQKSQDAVVGEWGESPDIQEADTPGITASQSTYGVRTREIRIPTYRLRPEEVLAIARHLVERNLNPAHLLRVIEAPPYPHGPDVLGQRATVEVCDCGSLVNMAKRISGGGGCVTQVGIVERWRYWEEHAPGQHAGGVELTVRVTESILSDEVTKCSWDEAAWSLGYWCPGGS